MYLNYALGTVDENKTEINFVAYIKHLLEQTIHTTEQRLYLNASYTFYRDHPLKRNEVNMYPGDMGNSIT